VYLSARLWETASYAYNPYALPPFACALIALLLGFLVAVRDRASRTCVIHLVETFAIGVWFGGFGMALLAADVAVADSWIRLGFVGVSFIPVLTLQFALSVVGSTVELRRLLWIGWVGAVAFAAAALWFPSFLGVPYRYGWGYYGHSTAYSALYVPFLAAFFATALTLFRRYHRSAHPDSNASRRARLFFLTFGCGGLGMVDLLPSFGLHVYPFGYLPVLLGAVLATYITSRYRLMDITPEFAARQIVETVSDGVLLLDSEGTMQMANETLLNMIRLPKEAIVGRRIPGPLRNLLSPQELASIQAGAPMHDREIEYIRRDGTSMILSFTASVIRGRRNQVEAYVCAVRDVTERKRMDQRVRFLAYYDNLTGLPNRQQFQERLRGALSRAARDNRQVALLFLDLDRFKQINDTLGHTLGDALLQAVAGRVIGCVRKMRAGAVIEEDTVARLGGDEFIVGLYELESREDAISVAERMLASISEPIRLDEHEVTVTASLGISVFPDDGGDAETLLKNADAAMYQAKQAGRNDYLFYGGARAAAHANRQSLEQKLRKALQRGHLALHYQPQVAMHGGHPVAVEAFLRWEDPDFGVVAPQRVIAAAEKSGLILPIGDWVLQQACRQARLWHDAGLPFARVAVNLSSQQFRDRELAVTVRHALDSTGLRPELLELEPTESMIMQDTPHTRRTLESLKAMGVHVSIDDFGTGYSSLGSLRGYPIDTLKIDRSFVHDIVAQNGNATVAAAIIAMARSLKIGVAGEGVETEAQRAFLQRHGCQLAQGFFFCEPLAPNDLVVWWQARPLRQAN
jgi:diguanylate cyclase (GGDEF)-like protein/PAS domain S-box-containing protein